MLESYRKWLVGIWGVGFLLPFILLLFQFGSGKYGGKFTEALGWLTSLTVPTILLMIGVLVATPSPPLVEEDDAKEKTDEERAKEAEAASKVAHEKFIFKLAVSVSIIYLLIINFVFFPEPLWKSRPLELMRDSKIFLAVFDAVISLLIGYFFGKK